MEDRWSKAVATAKYNGLRHWKTTNGERSIVVATGVVTFGSVTALSCYTQLLLGISTGAPTPLTTIAGVVTVCAASLASHTVAVLCTQRPEQRFSRKNSYLSTLLPSWNRGRSSSSHRSLLRPSQSQQCRVAAPTVATAALDDGWSLGPLYIPMHTLRICAVGLIAFKVLGGRFWALAPSSYTHPGSFARYSIPATERYATASQRTVLERLGRTWGCHTCGSRQFLYNHRKSRGGGSAAAVRFVGDHMPPKSVANQLNSRWYRKWTGWTVRYRFYPQCVPCSNKQGNLLSAAAQELRKHQLHSILFKSRARPLSAAGGGAKAHFHGFRPRIHHCTGGLLAGIATMTSSTTATAEEESRRYYTALQSDAEQWIRTKYKGNVQRHLPWLPSLPPPSRR